MRNAAQRSVPQRAFRDEMVFLRGGRFRMGSDRHYPEEAPAHEVTIAPFYIDPYPVTNREFGLFVEETGYVTVAERRIDAAQKEAPTARLLPGAFVFTASSTPVARDRERWWFYLPGACWRRPENGLSVFGDRGDHPVTCVAFEDCAAYATWAGKSLPTEAQWEYAARGGLEGAEFAWGDELNPKGQRMANTWSGSSSFPCDPVNPFPVYRTTPVDLFPANGYGLYDMIGNVWEWTSDRFGMHRASVPSWSEPYPEETFDLADDVCMVARVVKGGSFLCAADYSARYRPAARQSLLADTAASDVGFRCVSTFEEESRTKRRPIRGSF